MMSDYETFYLKRNCKTNLFKKEECFCSLCHQENGGSLTEEMDAFADPTEIQWEYPEES